MSNLIVEYQRRHKSQSIPVNHDGLCFFDSSYSPMIALTSLACRSFMTCQSCDKPSVIVELFRPGHSGTFGVFRHDHVDQATDLKDYVKRNGASDAVPFYAKDVRDLEIWLWKFCTTTLKISKPRKSYETDPKMKMLEQMAHGAIKYPKYYQSYYLAHEAFLLSRKYMLFA